MLGTPPGKVVLVPCAPEWLSLFQKERDAIRTALGPLALQIRHIGSTSIPGMPAKPTIDIVVVVAALEDMDKCTGPLGSLGYRNRGFLFEGESDHLYFSKPPDSGLPRTHQIHMWEMKSDGWRRHVMFRDYLEANRDAFDQYVALKQDLSVRHGNDRVAYANAKDEFVKRILAMSQER